MLISVRGTYYHYFELPAATFDAFVAVPRPRDWPPEQKVSQTCRTVELIGAANIFAPRSSRTAMKFPRLTKLGRSVPMRCAMKAACFLASVLDEHSCPMKSWARISPTQSIKQFRFFPYVPATKNSTPHTWLKSLCRPLSRSRRLRRCIFETLPGGFDLGLSGALASGPRLGGGGCVLGEVVPDDGAGNAMEEA
jgi:hypothetical protein